MSAPTPHLIAVNWFLVLTYYPYIFHYLYDLVVAPKIAVKYIPDPIKEILKTLINHIVSIQNQLNKGIEESLPALHETGGSFCKSFSSF